MSIHKNILKYIVNKFKLSKIKNKILIVMIPLITLPIILIGVISYRIAENTIKTQNIISYTSNLKTASKSIDIFLENIISISRIIMADTKLRDELSKYSDLNENNKGELYFYPQTTTIFDGILKNISNTSFIQSICLFDNYGKLYYSGPISDISKDVLNNGTNNIKEKEWYNRVVNANGKEVFVGNNVIDGKSSGDSFSCIKLIKNTNNLNVIGILIINIKKSTLNNIFPKLNSNQDNGTWMIVDKNNNVNPYTVYEGNSRYKEVNTLFKNKTINQTEYLNENGYLVSNFINSTTNWEMHYIIKKSDVIKEAKLIGYITFLVSLIMIFIVGLISIVFSNSINKPLKKLERLIKDVGKGKRNITEKFNNDEIGLIGTQFKKMINQNYELSEKVMYSNLKQKDAELKALQAQINPHFLYNTLDSIYWLAIIKKADDIAQMVVSLSEIFRLSLNKGNEITTISDELKHIKNYLIIQNLRYGDRFNVHVNVDDEILDFKILKLILQPFVENAFYHGLEPKMGEGTIEIIGKQRGENIIFNIIDDGVGMDLNTNTNKGYGIKNVQERIKLYYGDEYGVNFASKLNEGTNVTIIVSINKRD